MKVLSAAFLKSVAHLEQCPRDGHPEIAFAGRSNVGKSSLINALLGRKGLAKTSSTPGKTQTLNFFDVRATTGRVNRRLYVVDLPGYGFARAPAATRQEWGRLMTAYLNHRTELRLVVQLLDSRHAPTDRDLEMLGLLEDAGVATLIVATKIDKLRSSERARNLAAIRKALDLDPDAAVIPFSAVTGEGVSPVWALVDSVLESPQPNAPA